MTAEALEKLKQQLGRHFIPTVTRYRLHVETYNRLKCPDLIEPFNTYAADIIGAPEAMRDEMLAMPELEPVETTRRYRQYDSPTRPEQHFGTVRPRDKDRKR